MKISPSMFDRWIILGVRKDWNCDRHENESSMEDNND